MHNCRGCKHAVDSKEVFRKGTMFRCSKAEELFGGERWVEDLPGCKLYECIIPNEGAIEFPEEVECQVCYGTGKYITWFGESKNCYLCKKGENKKV